MNRQDHLQYLIRFFTNLQGDIAGILEVLKHQKLIRPRLPIRRRKAPIKLTKKPR